MKITLDNYEAFFLDYTEGRLNSSDISELSIFLTLYPALKQDLNFSENTIIQPNNSVYQNKHLIKKLEFKETTVNTNNFDDFCIAYYEHILSAEKTNELLNFCSLETQRQKTLIEYQKVFLLSEEGLKFQNKKSLYKKQSYTTQIIRIASIAASIAFLITVYLNYQPKKGTISLVSPIAASKITKQEKDKVIPLIVPNNNLNKNILSINKSIKLNPNKKINDSINNENAITSEPKLLAQIPLPELKLLKTTDQKRHLVEIINIEMQSDNKKLATSYNLIKNIETKFLNITELNNKKKNFSLLKIAQVGIKGINTLTDSNMSLIEKTDSTGNITALSFESDLLEYHRNKRN